MNFAVYTKENCVHCKQIKQIFQLKNINYAEYKLGEHFDSKSFKEEFGKNSTFPQVILNDLKLGGCSNTIKYLKDNNII